MWSMNRAILHTSSQLLEYGACTDSKTRSMQGMFGASVSELYLLIKLLINIERTVDLCVITKKEIHKRTQEL